MLSDDDPDDAQDECHAHGDDQRCPFPSYWWTVRSLRSPVRLRVTLAMPLPILGRRADWGSDQPILGWRTCRLSGQRPLFNR